MRTWQAATKTAHASAQLLRGFSGEPIAAQVGSITTLRPEPPLTLFVRDLSRHAISSWKWLERKRTQQLASRRLRVSETISLGEKRFVSIVQVDGAQFLIGGATGSVSLLARLDRQEQQDAADWRECGASTGNDR